MNSLLKKHFPIIALFITSIIITIGFKIHSTIKYGQSDNSIGLYIGFTALFFVGLSIYFLPTIISFYRKNSKRLWLFFLANFLLGWLLLPYIYLFYKSTDSKQ